MPECKIEFLGDILGEFKIHVNIFLNIHRSDLVLRVLVEVAQDFKEMFRTIWTIFVCSAYAIQVHVFTLIIV